MRYHVYIKVTYQFDAFIETVDNYVLEENGDLKLYDKGSFYFFPASVIQYLFIKEVRYD